MVIGKIHTPFKSIKGMPIQSSGVISVHGMVKIFPEFVKGLKDLDSFSHIILLYYFHKVSESKLLVIPFLDSVFRGVFATRAPKMPNPIGLSVVKLLKIEWNNMEIENVDILDDTPLLDIKPYVPEFDQYPANRLGWLKDSKDSVREKKSDAWFK